MATRAAIRTQVRAVYVHWDGYPAGIMPVLNAWVQEWGPEATLAKVFEYDWSVLLERPIDKGPDEGWDIPDRDHPGMGVEWVYDVSNDGVVINRPVEYGSDLMNPVCVVAWGQERDWDAMEAALDA